MMHVRVEAIKEMERARIAREIHDELGSNLSALKMAFALLSRRLPVEDGVLLEKAAYVDSLLDRTIDAVQRICSDLRPGMLDFGVVAALSWQAGEFEKQWGVSCVFSSNVADIALHADQATALFRIMQEALTNVGKHAHASHVEARLQHVESEVQLEIADNGQGIEEASRLKPESRGMRGMVERAQVLGGCLSVKASEGGGTVVSVIMPLEKSR